MKVIAIMEVDTVWGQQPMEDERGSDANQMTKEAK